MRPWRSVHLSSTNITHRAFSSATISSVVKRSDTAGRHPGFYRKSPRSGQVPPPPSNSHSSKDSGPAPESEHLKISNALKNNDSGLVAPVSVPEDPHGILLPSHPAAHLLTHSAIVIQRQLEMMNVMIGFEQANKYVIMDGLGNHIGYLAEQDHGIGNALARQAFRTHRSFTTHIFDKNEVEVLRLHRPFSWISSRIRVYDATSHESYQASSALNGTSTGSIASQTSAHTASRPLSGMRVIGEAQQQWAPLRRKYNLFLHRDLSKVSADSSAPQLTAGNLPLSNSKDLQVAEDGSENIGFSQFASVDEPFLSWDFSLKSADNRLIGSVNRNFAGFAREMFTDTGVYALRMDSAGLAAEPQHLISQTGRNAAVSESAGMTLDQRAVMLATAVSIDFDYFSRLSSGVGGGGFFPIWFPMGGAAAGEEAGAAGGAAAGGEGAAEEGGAAMREGEQAASSGAEGQYPPDLQSPQNPEADPFFGGFDNDAPPPQEGGDPFSSGFGGGQGGEGGGGAGDGGGFSWGDFFDN